MGKELRNRRKTIGVLVDTIDGRFEYPLWRGIKKAAEENDLNILLFSGMALKSPRTEEEQHNLIYNIININRLDGLIISAGTLSNFIDEESFVKFIDTYKGIPIVSISVALPNIPSIIFDNKSSMRLVVEHLIEKHNCSKIAFITGPALNQETVLRYEAYVEVMKEHDIPIDKNLIVEGTFLQQSAIQAVDVLLSERKILPQAIIASNDEMAIGANLRLKQLGFEIGKDIALTGFDNIETLKAFVPPLTTVSQPMFEIGSRAVDVMTDILGGKEVQLCTFIRGKLIERESCGCANEIRKDLKLNCKNTSKCSDSYEEECDKLEKKLNYKHRYIIDDLFRNLQLPHYEYEKYKSLINDLLRAFVQDIRARKSAGEFLERLNFILNDLIIEKKYDSPWNEALTSVRRIILSDIGNCQVLSLADDIFYMGSIMIGNVLSRKELLNYINLKRLYIDSSNIIQKFNSALEPEELVQALKNAILCFEIDQCYLCLYVNPIKNMISEKIIFPEKAKMVFAYNNKKQYDTDYFDTIDMLPKQFIYQEKRNDLLFLSLFSGNEHYGYIVFGVDSVGEYITETLRELVSNSLKSQILLKERRKAEAQLSLAVTELERYNKELQDLSVNDELTGLYNRRGFYSHAKAYYNTAALLDEKFTLICADLDGLKKINDTFGHQEGDEAIRIIGKALREVFGASAIIGRVGGDEFTIMVKNTSSENDIKAIVNKIHCTLDEYNSVSLKSYYLSISLGYACYISGYNLTFEELIKNADTNLYEQKRKKKVGRDLIQSNKE